MAGAAMALAEVGDDVAGPRPTLAAWRNPAWRISGMESAPVGATRLHGNLHRALLFAS